MANKAITKEYLLQQLQNFDSVILEDKYLQGVQVGGVDLVKDSNGKVNIVFPEAVEYKITKADTATSGYVATYTLQANTGESGAYVDVSGADAINIPKDFLVKSATLETVDTADDPVTGYVVGDKYIDFVINVYSDGDDSGSETDEHIYINVKDLFNPYTAGNGLVLTGNSFSVVAKTNGGLAVDTNGVSVAVGDNSLQTDASGLSVKIKSNSGVETTSDGVAVKLDTTTGGVLTGASGLYVDFETTDIDFSSYTSGTSV